MCYDTPMSRFRLSSETVMLLRTIRFCCFCGNDENCDHKPTTNLRQSMILLVGHDSLVTT